ncbi:MAG TPA: choice-of-anchor D domain-containing protein, partial [Chitinophagaceae bacterium]|nr:choice-of-anchor D domain-containing protein [Chitinophagaceae bacterium]
ALSISYTPASNTTLTIIDADVLSGTFSNSTGLASNWSINYNTGNGNVELIYTVPTTTLMNITSSGQSATSCKYTNTSGSAMTIRITATGGGGGNGYESFSSTVAPGSTGATMKGEFTLAPGETILAVAGAQGQNGQTNGDNGGGGGAGSGVVNLSSNSLLILAAGGGGAYWDGTGIAGSATTGGSGDGGEGLFSMGGGGFNGDGTIMFPANGCPTGGGQVSLTGISAGGLKCTAYSGGNGGSGMGGGGGASDQGGGGGGYTGGSGDYLPGGSALSYNTGANQVNTDGSNNAGPNAGSILIECVGSGCPTPAFTPASQPTLSATATTICTSQSTTLSILSGAPNDATDWYWYSGSCGGTAIGSGTSIVVSPSTTTTYYARGEGTCVSPGTCANITINFQTAEIDVTGNSNPIADGSNTPLLSNHTDFNTVAAGSTQVRTFTIENTGTSNLTISSIDLSGTNAGLFTVGALSPASPIPAGSTATFTVSFLPTTTGLKTATVTINNDDCNEGAYDFAIQGTGIQATTTLSLSGPSSSTLGSANTFTATLTRVSPPAGPMAGQTVTFTIVLPNSSTSNYNATTNASGEASISYSSIMTGVHAISADFLGNATHAASTSNILSHTVCTLPAITCPGNQNANTSSSTCDAIVTYAPSSVTGSPAPTITYSFSGATTGSGSGDGSGSTFNKGTTTVTLTATNTCGSASCSFDVVVSDNVPPVITCAADVNINNTPGLCSGTTTLTPPTVTDNCSSTLGNALDFDGTGTLNH